MKRTGILLVALVPLLISACTVPATPTPAGLTTPTSPPTPTSIANIPTPEATPEVGVTVTSAGIPTPTATSETTPGGTVTEIPLPPETPTPGQAVTPGSGFPPQRPTSTPAPEVTTQTIHEETGTPPAIIDVKYPLLAESYSTNAAAFNSAVKSMIDATITGFKEPLQTPVPDDTLTGPNSLYANYEITELTPERISVYFRMSTYNKGAAHPFPFSRTMTFDLANNSPVTLAGLFKPGADYLGRLSSLSIADLTARGELEWDTGAQPLEENFQNWNTTPEGLRITFDPYMVSSYATGYHEVLIPWSQLQDILAP